MSISDAEAVVMEVLWERGPLLAEDVVAALLQRGQWTEPTIKTLLNRLLNKRVVSAAKDGRRYVYTPVLAREDWVHSQSTGLLDRVFGGRVAPLVAHFSEQGRLTDADIAELRKLIREIDDGQ